MNSDDWWWLFSALHVVRPVIISGGWDSAVLVWRVTCRLSWYHIVIADILLWRICTSILPLQFNFSLQLTRGLPGRFASRCFFFQVKDGALMHRLATQGAWISRSQNIFLKVSLMNVRVAVCGERVVAGDVRGAVMKWQIGDEEEVTWFYTFFNSHLFQATLGDHQILQYMTVLAGTIERTDRKYPRTFS